MKKVKEVQSVKKSKVKKSISSMMDVEESLWLLVENIAFVRDMDGSADEDTLESWYRWTNEIATYVQSFMESSSYSASAKKSKVKKSEYTDAQVNAIRNCGQRIINRCDENLGRVISDVDLIYKVEDQITEMQFQIDSMNRHLNKSKSMKSKVKKRTATHLDKWYWESDNPSDRAFIEEVRNNGVVTNLEIVNGHAFRTYDYNGQRYEVIEHPDYPDGYGDMMILEPEPDYSVLTFDLFKKTIEDYLKQHSFADMPLDEYAFHDLGDGHYTFSYDGVIYELMNYDDTGNFKWGLHDALENAGFEWGVNIEQDTYSDIGYYNHANKSTKKSKQSFAKQVDKIRNKTYNQIGKVRK